MPETFFSISKVLSRLRFHLRPALEAEPFWVKAETSGVSRRSSATYFNLVESLDGRVVAQIRCLLWNERFEQIAHSFQRTNLDFQLEEGRTVGLLCRLQFHPRFGLGLEILDADPSTALGELERQRQQILAKLKKEGLLKRNRALPVKQLPFRIGLVASLDSAGYHDFCTTVKAADYGMMIYHADARVQGVQTEVSVCRALECLSQLDLDLVVLTRGGGNRTDLASLDSEIIARKIAEYDLPVWTAIGHDTDYGLLDAVSGASFKTPTAMAEHLVNRYRLADEHLARCQARLQSSYSVRVAPERLRLTSFGRRLRGVAEATLQQENRSLQSKRSHFRGSANGTLRFLRSGLGDRSARLGTLPRTWLVLKRQELKAARQALERTSEQTVRGKIEQLERLRAKLELERLMRRFARERLSHKAWASLLRAADPHHALTRGYAILCDSQGNFLTSIDGVDPGARVIAKLKDGEFVAVVESTQPNE